MEEPTMSEFPFTSTVPAPWMMTAADDPTSMAQSTEQFAQGVWEDWLNWAPQDAEQMSVPTAAQPLERYKSAQATMLSNGMIMPAQPLAEPMSAGSDFSSRNASSASTNAGHMFAQTADTSSSFQFTAGGDGRPRAATHISDDSSGTPNSVSDRSQSVNRLQTTSPTSGGFGAPYQQLPPTATPSLEHSPGTPSNGRTISDSPPSSPEPALSANKKKRKASDDDEEEDEESGKHGPVKKTAHNMIEKRYRTNLNDKIAALRDSVPSLRQASRPAGSKASDDTEDLEGLTPAHKLNKATVLSKATEYIRHLEKRNKRLVDEVKDLKTRLESQSKAAMSTPMMHGLVTGPDAFRFSDDFHATTAGHAAAQGPAQGMIPVPESMANLHRRAQNQAHYAQAIAAYAPYGTGQPRQGMAAQQPMVNGRGGNGMMNKLMVGSLAGLMIFEGLVERQKDEKEGDRGLFAIPIGLLRRLPSLAHSGVSLLPYFKALLLVTAFYYLINPLLNFKPKSKSKKAAMPAVRLTAPPSLAVPVELRRKAWLTAIQTVWVPRHNFFLELAALLLKTFKLSLRRTVGWQYYALLSGSTREHEDARVKAWAIALDAQLTGGDAEISISRLVLTLMASGTLPDTPLRLMLNALHIRVLLWEIANAGYGTWYMFEEISAKIARHHWNAARTAYKLSLADRNKADSNALPAHLAALLDIDCDDVLVQPLIQRAYNLAWNKPSAEKTDIDVSLDSVVEDFAITSPLDALAAWWSGLILNRSLVSYLAEDKSWSDDLDLAITTAPPTSGAQVRALVAKSIITDEEREKSVAAAFAAMPSQAHSPGVGSTHILPINVVGNAPVSSDVMKSLTMARCLSLAELSVKHNSAEARLRATFPIETNYISEYSLTLLSFVAAYRILVTFSADERLLAESRAGLERLASVLRVWVGRVQGRKSGLGSKTRGVLVERCLGISMRLTGMGGREEESDDGYVSGSDSGKKEEVEAEK